jgi:hypothetical protein
MSARCCGGCSPEQFQRSVATYPDLLRWTFRNPFGGACLPAHPASDVREFDDDEPWNGLGHGHGRWRLAAKPWIRTV